MDWETFGIGILGVFIGASFQYLFNVKIAKVNRLSEGRFKVYNTLWSSMVNLKDKGDKLWKKANNKNLIHFSDSLSALDKKIEESRLLLDEREYFNLKEILYKFEFYKFGKKRLIDLRDSDKKALSVEDIEEMTKFNEKMKKRYEDFVEKILPKFRAKIS